MPMAEFTTRAKFSADAEMHMHILISFISFLRVKEIEFITMCAGAKRRNGD